MAEIRAFRAIRYNLEKIHQLSAVVAPPYDLIGEREQERLRNRHPANVIRLILGKGPFKGLHEESAYLRAGDTWREWLSTGVLLQDKRPAIYIYEEEFDDFGRRKLRRGFVARVRLEEFGRGDIYPHEHTLSGPKEDRLKLMMATEANLSPIFSIFPDPDRSVRDTLGRFARGEPVLSFTDEAGFSHRIFALEDSSLIESLRGALSALPFFIADGHHRYETALAFRQLKRTSQGEVSDSALDYVMMMCVPTSDPGLVIYPIHRMVRGLGDFELARFIRSAKGLFDCTEMRQSLTGSEELQRQLARERLRHSFGMLVGVDEKQFLLSLRDEKTLLTIPGLSDTLRRLDVTILHQIILRRLLLFDDSNRENIDFDHDPKRVLEEVRSGAYRLGFLLNPTPVEVVAEVARGLERMPPKSTFFYPKVLSGILFNTLRET